MIELRWVVRLREAGYPCPPPDPVLQYRTWSAGWLNPDDWGRCKMFTCASGDEAEWTDWQDVPVEVADENPAPSD